MDNRDNDNRNGPFIKVWAFHDAPAEYRALSDNGGDEDYLVLIPKEWIETQPIPVWLEYGSFAPTVSFHELPDGSIICIGAHS